MASCILHLPGIVKWGFYRNLCSKVNVVLLYAGCAMPHWSPSLYEAWQTGDTFVGTKPEKMCYKNHCLKLLWVKGFDVSFPELTIKSTIDTVMTEKL